MGSWEEGKFILMREIDGYNDYSSSLAQEAEAFMTAEKILSSMLDIELDAVAF